MRYGGRRGYYRRRTNYRQRDVRRIEIALINICAAVLILLIFLLAKSSLSSSSVREAVPIENVAAFAIPMETFWDLKNLSNDYRINPAEALAVFSLENNFYPPKSVMPAKAELENEFFKNYKKIAKKYPKEEVKTYQKLLDTLLTEIERFPILSEYAEAEGEEGYSFNDSFGAARTYGGNRRHEGTDIMDKKNARGRIPIVSMTGGTVNDIGWGELGGYNIGIQSKSGNYYYYAHFDSFAYGLKAGDEVKAGQLIGYMGDSGYGTEGTKGQFAVHLHVGIKVASEISDDGVFWINPYPFLRNVLE